ncbi:peptidoglycan-binding protein [Neorhizobium galegae]|uniref:peptidoglycan-binding domain-containing protein n=1 Tax=Neorhizobium galegae TaxID=399 RepID=UPI002100FFDC|nr:peptidoglycan-binding protein [Neorhizobium galegae]MCQ1569671.1 peptidoglycan-binding protein [Neorhizobium galegae]
MTARKRKSPDRKKPVKQPGILSNLLLAGARAAARRPKALFGCAAFGIVFSFVAANALWYQPGGHPSPFLATRDAKNPNQIAGYRPARRTAPADVTTFRIERADPSVVAPAPAAAPTAAPAQTAVPSAPVPSAPSVVAPIPRPQPQQAAAQPATPHEVLPATPKPAETARATPAAPTRPVQSAVLPPKPVSPVRPTEGANARGEDPVAAAIRASERKPAMTPPANIPNAASNSGRPAATPVSQKPNAPVQPSDLVLQIQRGLSNIAYADVGVDGVAGAQTKAAIRRFQRHYRLPETGEPDELVLKKLKSIGAL